MKLKKKDKIQLVKELGEKIAENKTFLVTNYNGLTSKDSNELRLSLYDQKMDFKAVKKKLVDLALRRSGLEGLKLSQEEGQMALAWGEDGIGLVKAISGFAKKLGKDDMIVGGFLEGKFLAKEDIIILSQLPSLDVMRARLIGALKGNIFALVNVLSGNQRKLVLTLKAVAQAKS